MKIESVDLRELARGVGAYMQLDGGWFLNNAGFIAGSGGTVLIDQMATVDRAKRLLHAAESETKQPVRLLINTHHHGDHTNGNCIVDDRVAVVARTGTRAAMESAGIATKTFADYMSPVDWGEPTLRLPDVTIDSPTNLWVDELELRLLPITGPAHTQSDLAAWLPEHRILFSGDLAFNGVTPLAVDGSINGWIEALERLEALQPEVIVPGHGDLTDAGVFEGMRQYLSFVKESAADGFSGGRTPLQQARRSDLGEFATLLDSERLVANLYRAYAELGWEEAINPPVVLRAMVEFKGSPLESRC